MEQLNRKELVKRISYMVMGDGGLYFPQDKTDKTNAKFIMNMKKENIDYVLFCKNTLEQLTGCRLTDRGDYNVDGCNRQPQVRLESNRHPLLTKIHDRVYTGKYKGIDPHSLKMLDAESLAILYMCDGSFVVDKPNERKGLINESYNVTLNMKRLCYGDQFILKKALKEKLDLEFNINRQNQYYYLRLRMKDFYKFMEMVSPFVLPSFQYKIHEKFRVIDPQ